MFKLNYFWFFFFIAAFGLYNVHLNKRSERGNKDPVLNSGENNKKEVVSLKDIKETLENDGVKNYFRDVFISKVEENIGETPKILAIKAQNPIIKVLKKGKGVGAFCNDVINAKINGIEKAISINKLTNFNKSIIGIKEGEIREVFLPNLETSKLTIEVNKLYNINAATPYNIKGYFNNKGNDQLWCADKVRLVLIENKKFASQIIIDIGKNKYKKLEKSVIGYNIGDVIKFTYNKKLSEIFNSKEREINILLMEKVK